MADANSTSNIQIGDTVQIVDTRFSLGSIAWEYQRLWKAYGRLPGMHDADACVIEFEDGDQVAWEKHLLTRLGDE